MSADIAIRVEKLSKKFQLRQPQTDEEGRVVNELWALKDVSFEIRKGESVGIIGHNGSGKSTLLKILAGIMKPSSGKAEIYGRVASILDIGAGFDPELSGRENVYLSGQTLMGFTRKEIEQKVPQIISFSGIEKFIDEPVKNYSKGMYLRLAFSILAHLDFDVYLFDEVFGVGDAEFAMKTQNKFQDLLASRKTVLFASHNLSELSNQSLYILLEEGQLQNFSSDISVLSGYIESGLKKSGSTVVSKNTVLVDFSNFLSSDEIKLLKIELKQELDDAFTTDKPFFFSVEFYKIKEENVWDLVLRIEDLQGNVVLSTTPMLSNLSSDKGRGTYSFSCTFPPSIFGFQTYRIGLYFTQNTESVFHDASKIITVSESGVSKISASALRFENILLFKPKLKLKGLSVDVKDLNLAGGLLFVLDWNLVFDK